MSRVQRPIISELTMSPFALPRFLKTLVPRKDRAENERPILQVLKGLTWVQWGHFPSGYECCTCGCANADLKCPLVTTRSCVAWHADAIDFFSVSLSVTRLSAQFNRDISVIVRLTTTNVLLCRTDSTPYSRRPRSP